MAIVKTSSKCQIVIPKNIREKLKIKPNGKVLFELVDDHAEVHPLPDNPIKALRGIAKCKISLAKELIKERR